MSWYGGLFVLWRMYRNERRNFSELKLYTTDNLRQLYQATNDNPISLRDGIVSRIQLVAVIRWRVFCAGFGYSLLLVLSMISAAAAIIAAVEGLK